MEGVSGGEWREWEGVNGGSEWREWEGVNGGSGRG